MSQLLPLKDEIIYGPVRSRRLGSSLGINLLPSARKCCTFNCLYCHYGWTPPGSYTPGKNADFPSTERVARAVELALKELEVPPSYLTFSGNGEPTLHPKFPEIVESVVILRNRLAPKVKIALLSNASTLQDSRTCLAINRLDLPIMKLDAGNESMFQSFNRPRRSIYHILLITGLRKRRGITIQSLFAGGPLGNVEKDHLADWVETIQWIGPAAVQIYTLSRPFPCRTILPASTEVLLDIRAQLIHRGIPAEVF